MKQTECRSCGCKWWNVPEKISANMKECPFCKAPLTTALGTRGQVFMLDVQKVIANCGMEILADRKKFCAAFLDYYSLAPESREMMELLESNGGNELLYRALSLSRNEQITAREKFILSFPHFVKREAAYELCDAYWAAMGGEPFTKSHNLP